MKSLLILVGLQLSTFAFGHSLQSATQLSNLADRSALIVKFKDKYRPEQLALSGLVDVSKSYVIEPMLVGDAENYRAMRAALPAKTKTPHLENFYYIWFVDDLSEEHAAAALRQIFKHEQVEYAVFEPKIELAVIADPRRGVRPRNLKTKDATEQETPDMEAEQNYLKASPNGVDAFYAWEQAGGAGSGIKVIDLEIGWVEDHEDFTPPFFQNDNDSEIYTDHGTAVWGEIAAKRDGIGITGIAYEAEFGTAGALWEGDFDTWRISFTRALAEAIDQLSAGDVIILEAHAPGPDEGKYTAIEYWRPIFDLVKTATDMGIHVAAAAGNGDSNLDGEAYEGAFDTEVRDSGSVIVGAAGNVDDQHLERLYFSNYGSRVDAFGYGWGVTTTGYGDRYGSNKQNEYTSRFAGTSSATPIVTGTIASLSGMAKAAGAELTPTQLRSWLHTTGVEQEGDTSKHIGNLPNIRELHEKLSGK